MQITPAALTNPQRISYWVQQEQRLSGCCYGDADRPKQKQSRNKAASSKSSWKRSWQPNDLSAGPTTILLSHIHNKGANQHTNLNTARGANREINDPARVLVGFRGTGTFRSKSVRQNLDHSIAVNHGNWWSRGFKESSRKQSNWSISNSVKEELCTRRTACAAVLMLMVSHDFN